MPTAPGSSSLAKSCAGMPLRSEAKAGTEARPRGPGVPSAATMSRASSQTMVPRMPRSTCRHSRCHSRPSATKLVESVMRPGLKPCATATLPPKS